MAIYTLRNRGLALLLLFALSAPFSGQSSTWKTYRNSQADFSVLFPEEPTDTDNGRREGIASHTLLAQDGDIRYAVIYARTDAEQSADEGSFSEYKQGVFSSLPKCEIIKEEAAAPSIAHHIGRRYRLSCNNASVVIQGNLYWGKRGGYAVLAIYPATNPEPTNLKKFLDSFSVS